jgi:hypothetical protein
MMGCLRRLLGLQAKNHIPVTHLWPKVRITTYDEIAPGVRSFIEGGGHGSIWRTVRYQLRVRNWGSVHKNSLNLELYHDDKRAVYGGFS